MPNGFGSDAASSTPSPIVPVLFVVFAVAMLASGLVARWVDDWRDRRRRRPPTPSFRCPVCDAVSYNPNDVAAGYCGRCHDWTGVGS